MRVSRPLCADGKPAIFCVDYLPAKLIAEAGYQPEDLEPPISHFLNKTCHTADMIELVNGYTEAADLVELLSALKKEIRLPIITKAWAA